MTRPAAVLLVLLTLCEGGLLSAAPERVDLGTEGAITTLTAQIDIEREILQKDRDRYTSAASERESAQRRISELAAELDALAQATREEISPETPVRLEEKAKELALAEKTRAEALTRCAEALDQIRQSLERILLLDHKLAEFKRLTRPDDEPLTGSWDVTYLPSGDRGIFILRQSGTLVSGQYTLQGGWKGSLQGTFVGGKVYLQRIDSKLGRSSELEGYLESGGHLIRGTWQNYNLTEGSTAAGSWTAVPHQE